MFRINLIQIKEMLLRMSFLHGRNGQISKEM